jgi:hypothetical protein
MIVGIGNDLVDLDRFRRVLERRAGLVEKLFTESEREYSLRRTDPTERFAVRFAAKEAVLNAVRTSDTADTSDFEVPMDLAYRCVMPSPLGYAIHKVDPPPIDEPTIEEVAALLDINLASKDAEDRSALWRAQKPPIAVATALALGLRRLRAEVRRRVDAWKVLAASAASMRHSPHASPATPSPFQLQREDL